MALEIPPPFRLYSNLYLPLLFAYNLLLLEEVNTHYRPLKQIWKTRSLLEILLQQLLKKPLQTSHQEAFP